MEAAAGLGSGLLLPCGHPRRRLERNGAAAPPPPRSSSAPPRRRQDRSPGEQKAAAAFTRAILDCVHAYMALTEEDDRRYDDDDDELGKRIARVIKMHPPPPGLFRDPASYLKLLEDDED